MKKILEKSGNFVRGKKWEPCCHIFISFCHLFCNITRDQTCAEVVFNIVITASTYNKNGYYSTRLRRWSSI